MKLAALATSFVALFALPATAQQRDCGPVPSIVKGTPFVIDGDTVSLFGEKRRIRIWGVQAPELRDKATQQETVAGMRSRAGLHQMLAAGGPAEMSCKPTKYDHYCRLVAICEAPLAANGPPKDVGLAMIEAGLAYGAWLDDVAPDQPALGLRYTAAEVEARKNGRGLWKAWLGE